MVGGGIQINELVRHIYKPLNAAVCWMACSDDYYYNSNTPSFTVPNLAQKVQVKSMLSPFTGSLLLPS